MRGLFAELAEVAGVGGEATTEVRLPQAIHHHTGGERVFRRGQPAREFGAATGGVGQRGDLRVLRVEHAEVAGGDGFLLAALLEQGRRGDGADVRRAVVLREGRGFEGIELSQLLPQGDDLLLGLALELAVKAVELIRDLAVGQLGDLMLEGSAFGGGFADVRAEVFDEGFDGVLLGALAGLDEELVNLRADVGGGGFPLGELGGVLDALGGRGEDEVFAREERGEEGLEAVVILVEKRVELVVVATRALEADAEERVRRSVRDVFKDALPLAAHVAVVPLVNAGAEVAGGHQVFWVLSFGF